MTEHAERRKAESELLSSRILARSASWSLIAQALPAAVGLFTIPPIIHGLGIDRFGVLTLAWMVIGYFGFLDLGLGRAVTKFAAELMVSPRPDGNRLVWTAWYLMLGVGLIGGVFLIAITPWLVHKALKIPTALQPETQSAFVLLGAAVPIVVLTTGFRGLLEAAQKFGLTSFVKIPIGILTFIAPLIILQFTTNIALIVLGLVLLRLLGAIVFFLMCRTAAGMKIRKETFDKNSAGVLLRFGAWMTVSNILSPLMGGVDRFIVGALLSVAAVAYYATPYEAVTKLLLIPTAFAAVLFPAFSSASVIDPERLVRLYRTGYWVLVVAMYPIAFVVITFAPELLRIWLGDAFAAQSAGALRWLTVGVLTNSLASVPFALLQGLGRSDTTAKIHATEAPLYLLLMILLIRQYGINGAAVAWTLRTTADLVILFVFAERTMRVEMRRWLMHAALFVPLIPVLAAGVVFPTFVGKASITLILIICFGIVGWRWIWTNRRRLALG